MAQGKSKTGDRSAYPFLRDSFKCNANNKHNNDESFSSDFVVSENLSPLDSSDERKN